MCLVSQRLGRMFSPPHRLHLQPQRGSADELVKTMRALSGPGRGRQRGGLKQHAGMFTMTLTTSGRQTRPQGDIKGGTVCVTWQ